jgi:hypothetical protein
MTLGHADFNGVRRLLLGQPRQEQQRADEQHDNDNQYEYSGHGWRFCRPGKPLYSPLR